MHMLSAGAASAAGCFREGRKGDPRSGFSALGLGDFRLRASGTHNPVPDSTVAFLSAALLFSVLCNLLTHASQSAQD